MTNKVTRRERRKPATGVAAGEADGATEAGARPTGTGPGETQASSMPELAAASAPAPAPRRLTKTALLQQKLSVREGASMATLTQATGWQAHTVRAALTRLRQAGHGVERSRSADGETVYRIVPAGVVNIAAPAISEAMTPAQDRNMDQATQSSPAPADAVAP